MLNKSDKKINPVRDKKPETSVISNGVKKDFDTWNDQKKNIHDFGKNKFEETRKIVKDLI